MRAPRDPNEPLRSRLGRIFRLDERKRAYQLWQKDAILQDLLEFCRGAETTFVPGDRDLSLILEGRRQVWLRITQHLHLSEAQLLALYSGRPIHEEHNPYG